MFCNLTWISLIRDEDKDRLSDRGAAEQLRRRASSSSESILSSSTQHSSEGGGGGGIKPTSHNGAAQAPLSPSPASMQSQVTLITNIKVVWCSLSKDNRLFGFCCGVINLGRCCYMALRWWGLSITGKREGTEQLGTW